MIMTKKITVILMIGGLIFSGLNYNPFGKATGVAFGQNFKKDSESEDASPLNAKDHNRRKVNLEEIPVTRWVDFEGRKPIPYQEWKQKIGEKGPFQMDIVKKSLLLRGTGNGSKFCVIVNSSLYGSIQFSLDQYLMDLSGEGYDVEVCTTSGGTPEDLRSFLQGRYALGMEVCLLIGDLPVPWYETECWEARDHEEFPIDLFYMDLDGIFEDSDSDGLYDSHTGDVSPEICMGRLTASPLNFDGANEISLLQNYFNKNHLYRTGQLPLNNRALVYIDDDWVPWSVEWDFDMGGAYCERTFVNDEWTTIDTDYESRLPQNYEFIQICAHSSPNTHAFLTPSGWDGTTSNYEVKTIDPLAFFYNLFACSNARFVETNYMGGWYVFCQTYGLGAIGSAKTGSMLYFGDFYRPFGEGKTIGQAFSDWFSSVAADGFADWEVCWFYGMTLIGDPTLTIQKTPPCRYLVYDDAEPYYQWSIPDIYGADLFNVRFTTSEDCTLSTAILWFSYVTGNADARIYIWESDGSYPTTLIDSVDIPSESILLYPDLQVVDLSLKNITFQQGENFHIGYTLNDPQAGDTLAIYSDDGFPAGTEYRSIEHKDGFWGTMYEDWGDDYNFMIRAIVCHGQNILPPTLESPFDSAVIYDTIPTFSWSHTAGIGGTYTLQYDTNSLFPSPQVYDSLTSTTFTVSDTSPLSYSTYFWRVQAEDESQNKSGYQFHPFSFSVYMCGDANNDYTLNLSDVIRIANYKLKSGPQPIPTELAGDTNGDCTVELSDVIRLANYLLKSGEAPVPCEDY